MELNPQNKTPSAAPGKRENGFSANRYGMSRNDGFATYFNF